MSRPSIEVLIEKYSHLFIELTPDNELLTIFLIFTQIFAIMDPPGVLPLYLSFISGLDRNRHNRIVLNIALLSIFLITVFTVGGAYILMFFGVSIPATRIGGGLLLVAIAIDMLGGLPKTKQVSPEELAVVPIATPLLVGPGTITTLILLSTVYPIHMVLIGAYLVVLVTYIMLRYVDFVHRILGPGVIKTFGRLMAIIVASIAVEMIFKGIEEYIARIKI